jgi:hypothetical protein
MRRGNFFIFPFLCIFILIDAFTKLPNLFFANFKQQRSHESPRIISHKDIYIDESHRKPVTIYCQDRFLSSSIMNNPSDLYSEKPTYSIHIPEELKQYNHGEPSPPHSKRLFSKPSEVASSRSASYHTKTVNQLIKEIFVSYNKNGDVSVLAHLKDFINSNQEKIDHIHLLTILYKCSKIDKSSEIDLVELSIGWDIAIDLLERESLALTFDPQSIATAVYSLHNFEETDYAMRIINIISNQLQKVGNNMLFNGKCIGNIFIFLCYSY